MDSTGTDQIVNLKTHFLITCTHKLCYENLFLESVMDVMDVVMTFRVTYYPKSVFNVC